jgi:hypothetical protein
VAEHLRQRGRLVVLEERAAVVGELPRRDLQRAGDRKRLDLHRTNLAPRSEQPERVIAVAALAKPAAERLEGGVVDNPSRHATSSMQPVLSPCRSSTSRTNSAACISELNVPVPATRCRDRGR